MRDLTTDCIWPNRPRVRSASVRVMGPIRTWVSLLEGGGDPVGRAAVSGLSERVFVSHVVSYTMPV